MKNRNMFYNNNQFGGYIDPNINYNNGYTNSFAPSGYSGYSNYMSYGPNMMPNSNNNDLIYNNYDEDEINNRLLRIERQIRKLETRVSKLETNFIDNSNSDNDTYVI